MKFLVHDGREFFNYLSDYKVQVQKIAALF
jgi:hypothetical protein